MKVFINHFLRKVGYQFKRIPDEYALPFDMDKEFTEIFLKCKPYTKTKKEKMYAMYLASKYISKAKILGDIVECGVYRGGSSMVGAYTLKNAGDTSRKFYLYDTYNGMPEPTDRDVRAKRGCPVRLQWRSSQNNGCNAWCYATLSEVKENMRKTTYPHESFVFIEGLVEKTIPRVLPKYISLLRLDMDLYKPTKHALRHLFPRLTKGGVLLLDDYGDFRGVRDSVDEYFKENNVVMLLNRIDGAGRMGVKI